MRRAAEDGVETYAQLQACTGCGTCCGCCETDARRLLAEACAETVGALIPLAA
ncbi:MAG: (2Fe-2S)-binding protein [Rhodanobacteraceae bacterium]